jgi:hypothetical protein
LNKIYFSSIKDKRDNYFVEYYPPHHKTSFATLSITFLDSLTHQEIVDIMEEEAAIWLKRYPIAIMISAFNDAEDLIYLKDVKPENHLICFYNPTKTNIELHWELLKDEELPKDALDIDYLLQVYKSLNRKTSAELKSEAVTRMKKLRLGTNIIIFWAVILPAIVLVLEFFSPQWLAILVLVYGLSKALIQWLKMTGRWKKSAKEIAKDAEDLRIRHHHYHCERNPQGFLRLKHENFQKESKERTKKEAESIV